MPVRRAACLVATMALVAATLPADARTPARAKCFPPKAKELVRSKHTRVYLDRSEKPYETVACNYATGRRELLSDAPHEVFVFPPPAIDLAGVLVGFAQEDNSDPVGTSLSRIRVISVRTGREKSFPIGNDPGGSDLGKVGSLQVTPRASVAWIVCPYGQLSRGDPAPHCTRPGYRARVWKLERGSTPELLDEGTDIDPRSLGLRGTRLTWLRGGERRAATLGE